MNQNPDCIFCRIVSGEIPCIKLHETETTLAFMDINPLHPGHCLVIPKAHFANLYVVPDRMLAEVIAVSRHIARAVCDALAPEGLNLVQANGPAAAQSVPHFHFHVLPRQPDDNALLNWGHRPGDREEIGRVAEQIRARLLA